ncbi:MAG: hypothetical protein H7Z75_06340 [Ferruginibacter sp.]|nr:hypothetical protein [Cytophagales bacterium]
MKRIVFILLGAFFAYMGTAFKEEPDGIPRTWDLKSIKRFHLSPPDTSVRVVYAPQAYCDSLPEHVIYQTYPVLARAHEKPGYLDSLRQLEPEIAFDANALKTPEDWIKAGETVFNRPVSYRPETGRYSSIDQTYLDATKAKITPGGVYPYNRYVITQKGKLVWGSLSCASCHTRVMDSGELIAGAQGTGAGDTPAYFHGNPFLFTRSSMLATRTSAF